MRLQTLAGALIFAGVMACSAEDSDGEPTVDAEDTGGEPTVDAESDTDADTSPFEPDPGPDLDPDDPCFMQPTEYVNRTGLSAGSGEMLVYAHRSHLVFDSSSGRCERVSCREQIQTWEWGVGDDSPRHDVAVGADELGECYLGFVTSGIGGGRDWLLYTVFGEEGARLRVDGRNLSEHALGPPGKGLLRSLSALDDGTAVVHYSDGPTPTLLQLDGDGEQMTVITPHDIEPYGYAWLSSVGSNVVLTTLVDCQIEGTECNQVLHYRGAPDGSGVSGELVADRPISAFTDVAGWMSPTAFRLAALAGQWEPDGPWIWWTDGTTQELGPSLDGRPGYHTLAFDGNGRIALLHISERRVDLLYEGTDGFSEHTLSDFGGGPRQARSTEGHMADDGSALQVIWLEDIRTEDLELRAAFIRHVTVERDGTIVDRGEVEIDLSIGL